MSSWQPPIREFRDAAGRTMTGEVGCGALSGVEIIRPKPRRPGREPSPMLRKSAAELCSAVPHHRCSPTTTNAKSSGEQLTSRDLGGGSAPDLARSTPTGFSFPPNVMQKHRDYAPTGGAVVYQRSSNARSPALTKDKTPTTSSTPMLSQRSSANVSSPSNVPVVRPQPSPMNNGMNPRTPTMQSSNATSNYTRRQSSTPTGAASEPLSKSCHRNVPLDVRASPAGEVSTQNVPPSRETVQHFRDKNDSGDTTRVTPVGRESSSSSPAVENGQYEPASSPMTSSLTSTDYGSLGKSSSDGDAAIMIGINLRNKRMANKLKSKRRNILNLPQHLNMDARLRSHNQESFSYASSSDENRSTSGHASMSDGQLSSSPTVSLQQPNKSYNNGQSPNANNNNNKTNESNNGNDSSPTMKNQDEESRKNTEINRCGKNVSLKSVPEDSSISASMINTPKFSNKRAGVKYRGHPRLNSSSAKDELGLRLEGASGLEDIRQAIEQLSMRAQGSRNSYSTSTYSSTLSSSDREPGVRRLIRHSSLETINTNVTSADNEFAWLDGSNRLVELQHFPWTNHDVLKVLQNGRVKDSLHRVSMEVVPRLSYLLQRVLVRIAREVQRFSIGALGMCSKHEISSAFKVILSTSMSESCTKACLRAAAIYTVMSGRDQLRQSKSSRASLQLSVGKFHRWMTDVRLGSFIHEYAVIYLTAGLENLLEEIVLHCLPSVDECDHGSNPQMLSAAKLENAIANSSELWGMLQPYSHLNSGRTASGSLALPKNYTKDCNKSSNCMISSSSQKQSPNQSEDHNMPTSKNTEQILLTTCIGSIAELGDLLVRVAHHPYFSCSNNTHNSSSHHRFVQITWSSKAINALLYFMRCSQLEHANADHMRGHIKGANTQDLNYERPYIVLPPLYEWVRVTKAYTEHRQCHTVDPDDVLQASRLLLPGVDCPIRPFWYDDFICTRHQLDESECSKKYKIDLAFRMLASGRADLVHHALQLLPATTRINTTNNQGLTPLMLACISGDEDMVHILLDAGADINVQTPANSQYHTSVNPETQHWTALTYTTAQGNLKMTRLLLERGACIEGGAGQEEDQVTVTPLQLAGATGKMEMINLLLAYGAQPFLTTILKDSMSFGGNAQRGSYSAICVASAHGQRSALHKLISHPLNTSAYSLNNQGKDEILSLEEILAEGAASQLTTDRKRPQPYPASMNDLSRNGGQASMSQNATSSSQPSVTPMSKSDVKQSLQQSLKLSKSQIKTLQEAMYHSAENGYLEITLDLRNISVPWTLHCWMQTLATAHELRLENIIDQLLQDFLQDWPDDYSAQFVEDCLPLLFTIFRHSKNEGTTLLLADIFSNCYGKEGIKEIHDVSFPGGARIDPKYVNNPELSDVQFRVEGRVFYAHKIILVNSSPRFKAMLSSKFSDSSSPCIQINDIRYDIFQLVMQYLYKGGLEKTTVEQNDLLELMAATHFFQLDGLLRYCEVMCSKYVDLDNIVSMYIHAKVYNAVQLLEYCQGFLLQHMVALLTYDDSVRKLIFGKKLHNHDVLSGLLLTLQARIKFKCHKSAKN